MGSSDLFSSSLIRPTARVAKLCLWRLSHRTLPRRSKYCCRRSSTVEGFSNRASITTVKHRAMHSATRAPQPGLYPLLESPQQMDDTAQLVSPPVAGLADLRRIA